MLGFWRTHVNYQKSMIELVNREFKHNSKAINEFENAILKMYSLNLDKVKEDFTPLFSPIGAPSRQQPEIFRSFILMSHFKQESIEKWVTYAVSSKMICALVGVSTVDFPGVSTHYDFMTRLWQAEFSDKMKNPTRKPDKKHGKKKLPPKHPGIVKYMVEKALSGEVFKAIPERLLQAIFTKTALIPSIELGLLGDTSKLIVSADGTCIKSNASHFGKKVCTCKEKCPCPRKFADPDAKWGWDSYHEQWFYGYTGYFLSVHNPNLKLDLPIYLKFVQAQRNDSVTLIPALAHARFLYKDFLSFDSLLADAIHDNYPTYELLHEWNIKPFIDINNRSDNKLQVDGLVLSENGTPICNVGINMTNWGFDAKKYRIKYRCPLATGKIKLCPYSDTCKKSEYGKIVYLRLVSNLRLLTPVPRNTDHWREIYKQRTAAERVNNRILTDYQLERPKRYGKKKIAFFTFFNAINVHLDAQIKHSDISFSSIA